MRSYHLAIPLSIIFPLAVLAQPALSPRSAGDSPSDSLIPNPPAPTNQTLYQTIIRGNITADLLPFGFTDQTCPTDNITVDLGTFTAGNASYTPNPSVSCCVLRDRWISVPSSIQLPVTWRPCLPPSFFIRCFLGSCTSWKQHGIN